MKIWSTFRRWILADVHLWIALVAAAIFLLAELFNVIHVTRLEPPTKVIFIAITICLIAIIGDRLSDAEHISQTHDRVQQIAESFFDKRVALMKKPDILNEYESVWGGFTGDYFAWNPCFHLEGKVGEDDVVGFLVRRYENPRFRKAHYLFLTHDGTKDLDRFCFLMKRVRQHCSSAERKTEIRVLSDVDASSAAEMYFGTRNDVPAAVLEPKDPVLGPRRGAPRYYLIIHDRIVIEEHMKNFFDDRWDAATQVPL